MSVFLYVGMGIEREETGIGVDFFSACSKNTGSYCIEETKMKDMCFQ